MEQFSNETRQDTKKNYHTATRLPTFSETSKISEYYTVSCAFIL